MSTEPIPTAPGTYYGELSLGKEWFWNGTGTSEDQWIANPEQQERPEVAPLVLPVAKGSLHYIMGRVDAKIYQDHTSKPGPGGIQMNLGHTLTMNPADLIKAFGLTG